MAIIGDAIGWVVDEIADWLFDYPEHAWEEEEEENFDPLKDFVNRIIGNIKVNIGNILSLIVSIGDMVGASWLKTVVTGMEELVLLVDAIAKGDRTALIKAISGIYDGMVSSIGGLSAFVFLKIDEAWGHIDDVKEDVLKIVDDKLERILDPESKIMKAIADATSDVLSVLYTEIEISAKNIMTDIDIRVDVIEGEVGKVRYVSEDLEHFSKMFTELMES